jgi:N-hydroxyarylamine O-acetyltransferase
MKSAKHNSRLSTYLDRIGFRGNARPDLETLQALQRLHVHSIPFENLDVQLRRPVSLDLDACYAKIVERRRGGWCYELNGVFGWALREIGFAVTRVSAGVMRERAGDEQLGNHLCLLVQLDTPYLVDVGFGGSLTQPLRLEACEHDDSPYGITLATLSGGYWRFTERTYDPTPFSFDFKAEQANEQRFREKCTYLQTSEESTFVQNLVVQRRAGLMHLSLRGRVFATLHASHEEKVLLNSPDELVATLKERFDLDLPEAATLWPAICARHEKLFAEQATSD